jgi:non-heme chloroperoxidase
MRRWLILTCLALSLGGCSSTSISRLTLQTSDGVTLSILEAGKHHDREQAVAMAFVPGWSMPASIWQRQLEDLGKDFYVRALDPRGQGLSDVPESGYTAARRARDIKEFLQSSHNVLLVGWSLGAIESLQYIDLFGAERLAGLVLIDSSVGEEPAPPPSGTFKQHRARNHA